MSLIQSFVKGNIKGNIPDFDQAPDKIIETFIAKLFFSKDTVVKIYKNRKYFFANLKNRKTRRQFYIEDFRWNNKMSPSISQQLQGMKKKNNTWQKSNLSSAEDFYIKMKRIDDTKTPN